MYLVLSLKIPDLEFSSFYFQIQFPYLKTLVVWYLLKVSHNINEKNDNIHAFGRKFNLFIHICFITNFVRLSTLIICALLLMEFVILYIFFIFKGAKLLFYKSDRMSICVYRMISLTAEPIKVSFTVQLLIGPGKVYNLFERRVPPPSQEKLPL